MRYSVFSLGRQWSNTRPLSGHMYLLMLITTFLHSGCEKIVPISIFFRLGSKKLAVFRGSSHNLFLFVEQK